MFYLRWTFHLCLWKMPYLYLMLNHSTRRLFQYIQGANLNWSRIAMTRPILTSSVPGAGPLHSSAYFVRLYLPVKFQSSPPVPFPELNLEPARWPSHCIAVRQFSGFARDSNIVKEAEKLALSLSRSTWTNSSDFLSKNAYSIAQYSSPFRIIGRVNEVWADVEGSQVPGCGTNGFKAEYWLRRLHSSVCIYTYIYTRTSLYITEYYCFDI